MAIIQQDDIWHDFFYTELTTGLRRGEICGLKWTDFDEIDGTLKVRRTIHQEKGGKLTAWDTKTAAGARHHHPAAQYSGTPSGAAEVCLN